MRPLPCLKHPAKLVSHAADLLLLFTKTVLFQLKGTTTAVAAGPACLQGWTQRTLPACQL